MSRFEGPGGYAFIIVKLGNDFLAAASTCTHEEADLSLGILSYEILTCPLHQAKFNVRNGEVIEGPNGDVPSAIKPLPTFSTKVEEGIVFVDLSQHVSM